MECRALSTMLGFHAFIKYKLGPDTCLVGHTSCNLGNSRSYSVRATGTLSIHTGEVIVTFMCIDPCVNLWLLEGQPCHVAKPMVPGSYDHAPIDNQNCYLSLGL